MAELIKLFQKKREGGFRPSAEEELAGKADPEKRLSAARKDLVDELTEKLIEDGLAKRGEKKWLVKELNSLFDREKNDRVVFEKLKTIPGYEKVVLAINLAAAEINSLNLGEHEEVEKLADFEIDRLSEILGRYSQRAFGEDYFFDGREDCDLDEFRVIVDSLRARWFLIEKIGGEKIDWSRCLEELVHNFANSLVYEYEYRGEPVPARLKLLDWKVAKETEAEGGAKQKVMDDLLSIMEKKKKERAEKMEAEGVDPGIAARRAEREKGLFGTFQPDSSDDLRGLSKRLFELYPDPGELFEELLRK